VVRIAACLLAVSAVGAGFLAWRDDDAPVRWEGSWIATAKVAEVPVYDSVGAAQPKLRLANPTTSGSALVFLVDGRDAGGAWLPVLLPVRPNGSKGWVRAADVTLVSNEYRIVVDRTERRLVLEQSGKSAWEVPIGVGKPAMPTPPGRYFVKELVMPNTKDEGLYGPFALGLSGYSDSPGAKDFRGGDGVLAIHGTNDPDTLGERVSHGCIRVSNDVITYLARTVPMGTPVDIR
jgi:lipoprotein-anchoring transpeptidase ErfK/SrfK